ncbi:hypothetical protein L1049_027346 [Liquidambar formosana]|uniref:Uncharacterized protein n=1 Tax=Liquidambar formosana TaxID=63359 RepID=A0AAP0N5G8_LIQFO
MTACEKEWSTTATVGRLLFFGQDLLPVTKHGEVISPVKEGSGAARKNEKVEGFQGPLALLSLDTCVSSLAKKRGYMVQPLHAPQIFSDENPNACSVM